ncbi:MAG: hypothetical protein FJ186_00195 [Gammaproteobacteria bacterium]|nr:hypothetical protein [Gammaproteobacteria bacterium]
MEKLNLKSIALLLGTALLTACQVYTPEEAYQSLQPVQKIKVMDSYNQTLIVLQSSALFSPGTAQLKPGSRDILQDAMDVIEGLSSNLNITVTAYGVPVGNKDAVKKLSEAQAQSVAAFFWAKGVDMKRIKIEGKSYTDADLQSESVKASMMQYRVEVSLQARS